LMLPPLGLLLRPEARPPALCDCWIFSDRLPLNPSTRPGPPALCHSSLLGSLN
jgi:hypothetical protein